MKQQVQLQVSGMSCQHCVKAVEGSVGSLAGVEKVDVSLDQGSVGVTYDSANVDVAQIAAAIEDQGYDVAALSE